jgi:hypothetical protein
MSKYISRIPPPPPWTTHRKPYPTRPKPDVAPAPTGHITDETIGDDVLIRAHIHIDTECVVDLTITGTATEEGKARLIRIIELAMDIHIAKESAE